MKSGIDAGLLGSSSISNNIEFLSGQIGKDDETTECILRSIIEMEDISPLLLPLCTSILIENVDFRSTVALLDKILGGCTKSEVEDYLGLLQGSRYYIHRLSVTRLLDRDVDKRFIMNALSDDVEYVVKSMIDNLGDQLNDGELNNVISNVMKRESDYLDCSIVNLLVKQGKRNNILDDLVGSDSWRVRYSLAKRIWMFKYDVSKEIMSLAGDDEEDVRLAIVSNIDKFRGTCVNESVIEGKTSTIQGNLARIFVEDPSNAVKCRCVEWLCQCGEPLPVDILKWSEDVTSTLMKSIRGYENFETVTLPILMGLKEHKDWRIRKNVLSTCSKLINVSFDERVKNILVEFFFDKVHAVREECCNCMIRSGIECNDVIERVIKSGFKKKISAIRYVVKAYNKDKSDENAKRWLRMLADDSINDVKFILLDEMINEGIKDLDDDYFKHAIMKMCESDDKDLSEIAKKFIEITHFL